eukprot:332387-Hanusia_phi.AAC.1
MLPPRRASESGSSRREWCQWPPGPGPQFPTVTSGPASRGPSPIGTDPIGPSPSWRRRPGTRP